MRRVFWFAVLLLAAGCGKGSGESPAGEAPPPPSVFIAFARDFDNFESWEAFHPAPGSTGSTHVPGAFTVYLKARPPHGSTQFPVGTVIVKVTTPDGGPEQIFAMAKRAADYNVEGAKGWEWFELGRSATSTSPVILWRGIGAPEGEEYQNLDVSCNECHRGAGAGNDAVLAVGLGEL